MAIVTCPNCRRRYDPGVDEALTDMPGEMSLKVVCPACGQWLRLPEQEMIDPPDVPPDVLRQMSSQSRLVDEEDADERRSREDDDRPSRRRPRDLDRDDDERPRRRPRDDDYEERPRRRRDEDNEFDERPRRRHYDERDDYDDYPRRKPADGLGITSMVIGICSCVFTVLGLCCGLFSALGVLGGILAVVLGFVARSQNPRSVPAKTGIITGFIAIIVALLLIALVVVLQFGPGLNN
jgi:hypothetical protein